MMRFVGILSVAAWLAACGPGGRNDDAADDGGDDCAGMCTGLGYQECIDGVLQPPVECEVGQFCDPYEGCTLCIPDALYCVGTDEVWQCNADGTAGTPVETCTGELVCSGGQCQTPCQAAEGNPSNVGCDFWSVDLDNEPGQAAQAQYAVIIANNNDLIASVRVTRNTARVGEPQVEETIAMVDVEPRGIARINLPQREVDGTMGQNGTDYVLAGGSHTFVSPHAYHIVTSMPVVAYQFNGIAQVYSNDASTLIPIQALGEHYSVLGFPTANPCGAGPGEPGHIPGIPDHTAVTVVAIHDDTNITVRPTHRIAASGGDSGIAIPQTEPGTPITLSLDRYDVANLETWQSEGTIFDCFTMAAMYNGDQTGTVVESNKPVVVFTSHERGLGLGDLTPEEVSHSPDWDPAKGDFCCTEHFEEQLFPTVALGREFAVARSAIRSTEAWKEPDIYRILATEPGTVITTNLPAPYNTFTLGENQYKDFWATTGFTLSASHAVELAKILVPQQFIPHGFIGDPSFAYHPAAEQYRTDYVFLVPDTWQDNYMVLARPAGVNLVMDGLPFNDDEFGECYTGPIGTVAGIAFDQITCPISEGKHVISGDKAFGLMVFGYYSVGAYSFAGGSDVRIINPIE